MWSEEELRDIEPEPEKARPRSQSTPLRREISQRNVTRMRPHLDEATRQGSVIYAPGQGTHGNFIDASYRRILANTAWSGRLDKPHTSKRQASPTGADEEIRAWQELDCAVSSDALLMNIFCYPGILKRPKLCSLLGVAPGLKPEFGVRSSAPLRNNHVNTTEMDMRLGDLLIEAKLTESDFQFAPLRLLQRHLDLEEVFDLARLQTTRRGVASYQLLRGVLAARAASARFCVLCDARRPDLHQAWYEVMTAVRSFDLQSRMRLLTWQEVAACVPPRLQTFLADKYGIR